MAVIIEVNQEVYTKFKQDVLSGKIIKRIDINVSALEVNSLKAVSMGGTVLVLTPKATQGLMKSMGVSPGLIEALKSAYDDPKVLSTILNHIRQAKKTSKVITLVYNDKIKCITGVYPTSKKLISDQQYFDTLEAIIAKTQGSYLRNISLSEAGDIHATLANPNLEFQFGGMTDETFHGGMTFNLTPNNMTTSFFTERKICSNGATITDKLCTIQVNTNDKVPEFIQAVLSPEYQLKSIEEFKARLMRCYHTDASLAEVLNIDNSLKRVLGKYAEVLTNKMSVTRLKNTFGDQYLLKPEIHRYLVTDITLWDLTNEITAISSRIEQNSIVVPYETNAKLQILGGDCMFKMPNLCPSNIKQVFKK